MYIILFIYNMNKLPEIIENYIINLLDIISLYDLRETNHYYKNKLELELQKRRIKCKINKTNNSEKTKNKLINHLQKNINISDHYEKFIDRLLNFKKTRYFDG
jgi:hypothetical protein